MTADAGESAERWWPRTGTSDPDLSAFHAAGGKLIPRQGDADRLIPTGGTVGCRRRVAALIGGARKVDDLAALTARVGNRRAPAVPTAANGQTAARDVCRHSMISRCVGRGDPPAASGFGCVPAGPSRPGRT
ncbi:tannase/feruloyl esterase family alpha/beta hydrolase [Streptomyces botrytidirepellens]|uniref:Tannase/feruloyl esterase family alpha/beta hydrolase n=1 Tax=Streptomyces botrytidirepellens TaxID=2486417 RepID=A0A3M8W4F1_9ACTN|nr:tannase/feruloyl esterase family alpha/beta hydrolase [Streptomyces botrytidirepellens]RNG23531.1 tannase/feruloyl esterase family alpha/beta hydrolase [Streptomyces botrytidirepellens]